MHIYIDGTMNPYRVHELDWLGAVQEAKAILAVDATCGPTEPVALREAEGGSVFIDAGPLAAASVQRGGIVKLARVYTPASTA